MAAKNHKLCINKIILENGNRVTTCVCCSERVESIKEHLGYIS